MTGVKAARLHFWRQVPYQGRRATPKAHPNRGPAERWETVDRPSGHRPKKHVAAPRTAGIDAGWVPQLVAVTEKSSMVQRLRSAVFEIRELRFSACIRSRYRFEWSFVDPSCGRH
jgi:hypothetical protein